MSLRRKPLLGTGRLLALTLPRLFSSMAKQNRAQIPAKRPAITPIAAAISGPTVQSQTQVYQGPVPHPSLLKQFDDIVPGTAARMIALAEDESRHRRHQEELVNSGNIAAQAKQLAIADYQTKAVFRSDMIGQIAGIAVSLSCIAGAVYLATQGQWKVAIALAALPTAAVIQAFFAKRTEPKR
jgi:uncharacterized membrane protein